MGSASDDIEPLEASPKRIAQRLLTIGENRLELFLVEVQEERERLLHAILLSVGAAVFGLLAGIAFTATVVVVVWSCSPAVALLTLTGFYAARAVSVHQRFTGLVRDWQNFPATLDQLRKDRACFG